MHILILAGGGGHTGYAYALAQRFHDKGVTLSFIVPDGDSLSAKKLSKFGKVEFITRPRGPKTSTSEFGRNLAKAFLDSVLKVSGNFDAVICTGSNFCIPPAIISWLRGIPLVNIESEVRFTRPSITSRLLEPFTTINALQWEEQKTLLRGVVVGPILPKPEIKPWNGGYILVTGGTYGHKLLFDILNQSNLKNVVLQVGEVDPSSYAQRHPEWKIIKSTEKFYEILAGADIVITHFGFTVLETLVYKKPQVMVVNPEWTRTVGIEDAKYLANKTNAVLISRITVESLLDAIDKAKQKKTPKLPDGAENLANTVMKISYRRRLFFNFWKTK